jgi:hypothetical protein
VDAEADLRPAPALVDGQPQQPEQVPQPARFVLAHDAGRLTAEVYRVPYEYKDPRAAVSDLMLRQPKRETEP